jgi:hypothetical protein
MPIKINLEPIIKNNSAKAKRRRYDPKEPQLDKYSDRAKPPTINKKPERKA